jgi:AraC-like DNA-binding protein
MKTNLTIRSYSKQFRSHVHPYYQLVLPLQGSINIKMEGYCGKVTVGECVVILCGIEHAFNAEEAARFIVVDMDELPENIINSKRIVFSLTPPMMSFLQFIEKQIEFQVNMEIESDILNIFSKLLSQQADSRELDTRIRDVKIYISQNLERPLSIQELADMACLSATQFKKVFTSDLGVSVYQYIIQERMEKAKALIVHTDLPFQHIAEKVGYKDQSAFSRRFANYYGIPPRGFSRK